MTGKGNVIQSQTVSQQRRNKYVFSLFLNTDSDEADVTSLGRPFHTISPATGKTRPPIVDRRQVGTSSCSVEADLSTGSQQQRRRSTALSSKCWQCRVDSRVGEADRRVVFLRFCLAMWLGSRVVSVLDSGAERPGCKSQLRCCQVTVLGKLFTPIVPLFTKQHNW